MVCTASPTLKRRYFCLLNIFIGAAAAVLIIAAGAPVQAITQRDVLIKAPGQESAVYYLANNGKRYVFPNEGTFYSWYTNFSSLIEIPYSELVSYPLGGNVTYRAGYKMVKITTDPKVYAVGRGGVLHWVTSETVARRLYGSDWNKQIHDVPDEFFVNYAVGAPIYTDSDFSVANQMESDTSIGADKSLAVSAGAPLAGTEANTGDAAEIRAASPAPAAPSCSADTWECSSWGSCTGGIQTRACMRTYDCAGVDTPQPLTAQSCSGSQPSSQSCTADTWDCSAWGSCSSGGVQTRICTKMFDCPSADTASPAVSQSCTPGALTSSFSVSANLPASATVHPGDSNVPMLGFTLSAGSADYLILSITAGALIDGNNDGTFSVASDAGANFTSDVTACRLYDGSTQVGPTATPNDQGMVAFGLLSVYHTVHAGDNWALTIKCDISATAGQHKVALSLTPTNNMVPVGASGPGVLLNEGVAGLPVNGNGTTSPTAKMTIAAPGMMVSMVSLPTTVLTNGSIVAARFTASAGSSDSVLKDLTFTVNKSRELVLSGSGDSSLRQVGIGSNLAGTAALDTCNNLSVQCSITVSLLQNFTLPANTSQTLDLLLSVSGSGAGSNLSTSMAQPVPVGPWTLTSSLPAPSVGPVISLVALPSTVLTTGDVVAFRFTVSATGDVSIKHLTARVSPSMANAVAITTTSGSSVRRVGDGSNLAGAARINGGAPCLGNGGTTCDVEVGFTSEEVIAGGTSRTYDLRLNLSGSTVTGDSLTVSLLGDSGAPVTGQLTQVGGAWDYRVSSGGDKFVWSDNSAIPHSDALAPAGSADWTNGLYVNGLPTDTETMFK